MLKTVWTEVLQPSTTPTPATAGGQLVTVENEVEVPIDVVKVITSVVVSVFRHAVFPSSAQAVAVIVKISVDSRRPDELVMESVAVFVSDPVSLFAVFVVVGNVEGKVSVVPVARPVS
jgi:hypothetical protein